MGVPLLASLTKCSTARSAGMDPSMAAKTLSIGVSSTYSGQLAAGNR
jgi:hypothetical protein